MNNFDFIKSEKLKNQIAKHQQDLNFIDALSELQYRCKSKNEYPQVLVIVENPCGQTCGQCGKLRVINRYFPFLKSLPIHAFRCITHCIISENRFPNHPWFPVFQNYVPGEKRRKSWIGAKKCRQKMLLSFLSKKIFVENPQKSFLYHLPSPGNTLSVDLFKNTGGTPCRAK